MNRDASSQIEAQRLRRRLLQERAARAEAEATAEKGLKSLYKKQQDLDLLLRISSAANSARSFEEALRFAIDQLCRYTGWPIGHAYLPDQQCPELLVPSAIWYFDSPDRYRAFRETTDITFLSHGVGLPGRVASSGNSAWVVDVAADSNFPRCAVAREHGIHSAFAFGIWLGDEIAAILEFFSQQTLAKDPSILEIMGHIATQLSRVVERERAARQIYDLAYHDSLTGLPNRRLFKERLDFAIEQAQRTGRRFALMFLDLDRFKTVNDNFGHRAGDILLDQAATRLNHCAGEGVTVARWAGDEFVMLVPDVDRDAQIERVARNVLDVMYPSFMIGSEEIYVTFSIGAAVYPEGGESADTLLCNADTAVYKSKSMGRNRFEMFNVELARLSHQRRVFEANMRRALDNREFVLHYQPLVDIRSRRIIGVEALVRWASPENGVISPLQFIPIAEEAGMIVELGSWVLETACDQVKRWQNEIASDLRLSVNLSLRQFQQADLVALVTQILQRTGFEPRYLELEITESVAIGNLDEILTTIGEIRNLGVRFALDDFGTGYSSLSSLSVLPVDSVKIDKSFVQSVLVDARRAAIARSMIQMARSLNMLVIAEGVEQTSQLEFLKDQRCDAMQGFLFSKPAPSEEIASLLRGAYDVDRRRAA